MKRCQCGHSEGMHYHTNNLASCATCGPQKCQKFKEAPEGTPTLKASLAELSTNRVIKLTRGRLSSVTIK